MVNQDRWDGDTPNVNDQKHPSICVGANSTAYAVWQDERSDYKKIYYGWRGSNDTTWSLSEKVTSGEGGNTLEQFYPDDDLPGPGQRPDAFSDLGTKQGSQRDQIAGPQHCRFPPL
jgi:hypothetical protein